MSFAKQYPDHDAIGLAQLVASKQVSPREVVEAAYEVMDRLNPALNAITGRMSAQAAEQALAVIPGASPLAGAPIVMKDEYQYYAGYPTQNASRLRQGFTLPFDTEIIKRYKAAGVMVVGKTNLPEFGASVATEPVLNGICNNPWDPSRGVGGSSGGSSCAVAAGMVPFAYGNDGAGSIRIPASVNGIFGLKPTRARVPCGPLFGEIWNGLVIEGHVSRSVRDSAALLDAIEGRDLGAPYSAPTKNASYLSEVGAEAGRLRIALCTKPPYDVAVDLECVKAAENAAKLCEQLGHIVEMDAPRFDGAKLADSVGKLLAMHLSTDIDDIGRQMDRTPGPHNIERNHWALYHWGKGFGASDLIRILNWFGELSRQIAPFFEKYDVLLTPTLALPPRPHGWVAVNSSDYGYEEYLRRFFAFIPYTPFANVTGQPAMSVPLHWTPEGLPVGVHFVAPYGREDLLFRLAGQLEVAKPWKDRHPGISAWRHDGDPTDDFSGTMAIDRKPMTR